MLSATPCSCLSQHKAQAVTASCATLVLQIHALERSGTCLSWPWYQPGQRIEDSTSSSCADQHLAVRREVGINVLECFCQRVRQALGERVLRRPQRALLSAQRLAVGQLRLRRQSCVQLVFIEWMTYSWQSAIPLTARPAKDKRATLLQGCPLAQ